MDRPLLDESAYRAMRRFLYAVYSRFAHMLRNDAMLIHRSNICLIVYMCFHYIVIGNITDNITVAEQNIIFF